MTAAIAPKSALAPTAPTVGIFWLVSGCLVVDRSILDEAEPYGDCLTHAAGHYERWMQWQVLGGSRLVSMGYPASIAVSEYDEWPRGRIVHERLTGRFIVYADRRLQKTEIIDALIGAFGLNQAKVVVRSDPHYR